jgi:acyl-[acyl-carrier-protein]-phospholipid O-acyltransferase/long-chain-fatty-acid--[acyl-carrier-protein] ligase
MSLETATKPAGSTRIDSSPDAPLSPLPQHWKSLPRAFVHQARALRSKVAMVDSTGASLTYGDTFLRAVALSRVLAREIGPAPYVGLMLPPTVPAAVANIAVALLGKIPVNLNYTAGPDLVDSSIDQCGITHIITARRALDKFKLSPKGTHVYLEDVPKKVTTRDKVLAAFIARAVPIPALGAFLPGLRGNALDETATIIFTSGSTGDPKGVVLSHRNVLCNIHQVNSQVALTPDEVVLGILPFFHSFGFTITVWTVLCLGKKAAYHFNPLDARIVGNLCQEHAATVMAGTPTFMRNYLHRCDREQFASIRLLLLGAEKLKPELAREIRDKFGIEPLEGYGCTELTPIVAVNVPNPKQTRDGRSVPGNRPGTVGMPVPGTAIKAVDPDTGENLPRGSIGIINVKGPQVMQGYLHRPEATAKVVRDGWYSTGDLGYIDADGFLTITDRLSRFSKIGGEMVPHLRVESALMEATGADELKVAVTAIPDPKRGERLVVIYTDLGAPAEDVYRRLMAGSLPKLWLPAPDSFVQVEGIPVLGTGKIDLRKLREIAEERLNA